LKLSGAAYRLKTSRGITLTKYARSTDVYAKNTEKIVRANDEKSGERA